MPTYTDREQEALDAHHAYVAQRVRCEQGEAPWSSLQQWFTPDAVFLDPAWGRVEGHEDMTAFFDASMAGLDGWEFPEGWTTADGDRVVSFWWNRVPGEAADGRPLQAPAVSVLHYAGDGRFDYELDVMNMAEVIELLGRSSWRPGDGFRPPGTDPVRDPTPPRLATP